MGVSNRMNKAFTPLVVFLLAFLLSSCAHKAQVKTDVNGEPVYAQIQENEVSSEDVERRIEQPYQSQFGEVALDYNPHVEKWIRYFQGRGRKYMDVYLTRSTRYLPMMKNVLRENGLPEELVYIALIESGFSPRAHSRANAVGYWQFIRATGKRYGLQVDAFIDERRDPVLATRAAAQYFKELYGMFGSWHLSMAAYNYGEGRIKRAVRRHYTKDFWTLIKKRRTFPAETKNYVPKFIAAAMIAKDPARFGFEKLEYQDPLSYDTVALVSPISLTKLANNLNVDVEEMQLLNPKFRTDFVPLSRGNETIVRIPVGRGSDAMAALSMSVSTQPKIVSNEYFYYRIRHGDNLSTIARRHRTTVSNLRRMNGLSNRTMIRAGRRLKVPDQGGDGVRFANTSATKSSVSRGTQSSGRQAAQYHQVRRGENLSVIARRYGVSIRDLVRLNNLSSRSKIYKGQKLKVRPDTNDDRGAYRNQTRNRYRRTAQSRRSIAARGRSNGRHHRVRRGETLTDLSQRYGVSLRQLANANGFRPNHRTLIGERITIPD